MRDTLQHIHPSRTFPGPRHRAGPHTTHDSGVSCVRAASQRRPRPEGRSPVHRVARLNLPTTRTHHATRHPRSDRARTRRTTSQRRPNLVNIRTVASVQFGRCRHSKPPEGAPLYSPSKWAHDAPCGVLLDALTRPPIPTSETHSARRGAPSGPPTQASRTVDATFCSLSVCSPGSRLGAHHTIKGP